MTTIAALEARLEGLKMELKLERQKTRALELQLRQVRELNVELANQVTAHRVESLRAKKERGQACVHPRNG